MGRSPRRHPVENKKGAVLFRLSFICDSYLGGVFAPGRYAGDALLHPEWPLSPSVSIAAGSAANAASHARNAAGELTRLVAMVSPLPILMETPPCPSTARKPFSSVRSSPAKSGRRPRYGAVASSASTARPLPDAS